MRKLLAMITILISVATIAITSCASAASNDMPLAYRGTWCASDDMMYFPEPCDGDDSHEMVVKANAIVTANSKCFVTKVTQYDIDWGGHHGVNAWGPGHRIKFRCTYGNRTQDWQIVKGQIRINFGGKWTKSKRAS